MPTPQQSEGKDLHRRFAEAAKGVTELYRNATLSYNAGYRDALLLVERYALIAAQSGEATPHGALRRDDRTSDGGTDRNSHLSDQSISNGDSISISSSQDSAIPASRTSFAQWGTQSPQLLNIKQLLWFIQNIVKSHDALTGAPRTLKRRRRRSCSSAGARGCAVGNDNEDNTSSGEGGGSGGGFGGLPIPRFRSPQHRAENWNELLLLGEGRATPHTDADGINSEDHECKARAAKHRESKGRKTHSDMPPHRKHPARGRSPRNKRYNGEGKPATKRGRSWSKQPSGPLTTNCDGEASSYTTAGTPPVASDHKFCEKTRSTKPSLEVTRTHIAPNTTTAAEVIPNASVTSAVGSAGGTETAATPTAKGADNLSDTDMEKYNDLQRLLRRIIALEFSERCTQRSITVVTMICETLCTDPVAIVKVMEVVDQCFGEAVRGQEPRLLMHYWYILDAILKHFNGKPHLLKAVLVAIPHFVRQYLPWRGSNLAGQPWSEYDKYRPAYEDMLGTWKVVLEERALEEIMKLWREGMGNHYADEVGNVGARVPLGNATADSQNSDAAH